MNVPARRFRLPPAELNRRELEVAGLLADGRTTNEIAEVLRISAATVRQYIDRATEKAGVSDRWALIGWVRRQRGTGGV